MKGCDKPTCGDHGGTRNSGDPCERVEGWGTDFESGKCKQHRGTSPDGESHKGNDHATKHFAFRKPEYLENDIQGTDYEDVFIAGFEALCTMHEDKFGSEPNDFIKRRYRRFVIKDIKEDLIDAYLHERQGTSGSENPLVEQQIEDVDGRMNVEKANKLLTKMSDLSREIRLGLKDFGLLHSPEQQKAEGIESLAVALSED